MEEIWKPVKGFEDRYAISNLGRFKFLPRRFIMKDGRVRVVKERLKDFSKISNDGYLSVGLHHSAEDYIQKGIHILVAEAFVPNDDPEHKTQVNHIDGDRQNNCADNLEWVTPSENVRHAWNIGRMDKFRDYSAVSKSNKTTPKPVKCLNDGKVFDSIKAAGEYYKIPRDRMYRTVKEHKSIFGLEFEYLPKEETATRGHPVPKLNRVLVNTHKPKPVYCVETDTWYKSRAEAARQLKISGSSIVDSLREGRRHAGYTFME